MKQYDYLIVGAGLFGAVFAHEAKKAGKKCLVIDKRDHIAGNIYTENVEGINVHRYGAHIFHTNNKAVWQYVNQFAEFNRYTNSLVPCGKGHVCQRNAGVGGKVAGDGGILHHGCIKGGQLVRFGRALLRRQIASPLDQRLYLGDHFRALHQHQTHRLPVCPAGGQPHGLYNIIYHILRHGLLCKPAVGAAGGQKFHCMHRDHSFYKSHYNKI